MILGFLGHRDPMKASTPGALWRGVMGTREALLEQLEGPAIPQASLVTWLRNQPTREKQRLQPLGCVGGKKGWLDKGEKSSFLINIYGSVVALQCCVALVSAIQQSESDIYIYIYLPSFLDFIPI